MRLILSTARDQNYFWKKLKKSLNPWRFYGQIKISETVYNFTWSDNFHSNVKLMSVAIRTYLIYGFAELCCTKHTGW